MREALLKKRFVQRIKLMTNIVGNIALLRNDGLYFISKAAPILNQTAIFATTIALESLKKDDKQDTHSSKMMPFIIPMTVFTCACIASHFFKCLTRQPSPSSKDIVLVLQATFDETLAFEIGTDTNRLFSILEKDHYEVMLFKVSTISQFGTAIRKVAGLSRKIKALWVRGHGDFEGITLGSGNKKKAQITIYNINKLKDDLQMLDEEACIILDSCSTGRPEQKKS